MLFHCAYLLEFELILLHVHQVLAELMHFFEACVVSLVFVNHKTDGKYVYVYQYQ